MSSTDYKASSGPDKLPPSHPPHRLLVLDDDPATGATICRIAQFSGAEAFYAADAETFFRQLEEWLPDTLALDLVMPGKDGVEVMAELGLRGCKANIIITSGVGSRVLNAASRAASDKGLNIIGVLAKPFSAASLRELLELSSSAINRSSTTRNTAAPDVNDTDLRLAIEHHQIHYALQPKFNCPTGTLAGFEVLARWTHPQKGMIPPDLFIARAEALDLIDELTRQVSEQALQWLSHIDTGELPAYTASYLKSQTTLSINLSALLLGNAELFEWMAWRCQEHGIEPERIIFEITETSAMKDPAQSLENLTRLRMQGFRLSIDDFGTGYSSMLQLVRLPFSEIKVDKTFVINAASSAESRAVIRSVIELGHSLGLTATAEGVEDMATLDFLRSIHCNQVQGFLISRPQAPDRVMPWFTKREQKREQTRVGVVRATGLLDSAPEARFDRITRLARRLFNIPVVLIVLIDDQRQYFKSSTGVTINQVPRGHAFCDWTLAGDQLQVVPDTTKDKRFCNLPSVLRGPRFRFYAGRPVCLPDGTKVGTLCMMENQVRTLDEEQQRLFCRLADMVEGELAVSSDQVTDSLSGLPDRTAFRKQMEVARELTCHMSCRSALITVTLNNLGEVNRRLGRDEGNRMIRQLSQTIRQLEQQADLVGRYRGNEFGLMLIDNSQPQVDAFCEALASAILDLNHRQPDGHGSLSCHIGLAWLDPDTGTDIEMAIERARQQVISIPGSNP